VGNEKADEVGYAWVAKDEEATRGEKSLLLTCTDPGLNEHAAAA